MLLLHFFKAKPQYRENIKIIEVRCLMPLPGWTKVNIDGAARGQPGIAACGVVFRMFRGFVKGSFAMPLGVQSAMFAEIIGLVQAVKLARIKNWFSL